MHSVVKLSDTHQGIRASLLRDGTARLLLARWYLEKEGYTPENLSSILLKLFQLSESEADELDITEDLTNVMTLYRVLPDFEKTGYKTIYLRLSELQQKALLQWDINISDEFDSIVQAWKRNTMSDGPSLEPMYKLEVQDLVAGISRSREFIMSRTLILLESVAQKTNQLEQSRYSGGMPTMTPDSSPTMRSSPETLQNALKILCLAQKAYYRATTELQRNRTQKGSTKGDEALNKLIALLEDYIEPVQTLSNAKSLSEPKFLERIANLTTAINKAILHITPNHPSCIDQLRPTRELRRRCNELKNELDRHKYHENKESCGNWACLTVVMTALILINNLISSEDKQNFVRTTVEFLDSIAGNTLLGGLFLAFVVGTAYKCHSMRRDPAKNDELNPEDAEYHLLSR